MSHRKLDLDEIVFCGRTFNEYLKMFDLSLADLKTEKVLDCPGGACSFVAELNKRGVPAVACDIMYDLEPEPLESKCRADLEKIMAALPGALDLYNWDFYDDMEDLKDHRLEAYTRFIQDYPEGKRQGRYVQTKLPKLPFPDNEFSLVISAHFLFLYGDRLDFDFHVNTIKELVRVSSKEVRIFPLVGLDARRYSLLDRVIGEIADGNVSIEIAKVPFEFQKGADEMLLIRKKGNQTTLKHGLFTKGAGRASEI